jgi:hypothetical protein
MEPACICATESAGASSLRYLRTLSGISVFKLGLVRIIEELGHKQHVPAVDLFTSLYLKIETFQMFTSQEVGKFKLDGPSHCLAFRTSSFGPAYSRIFQIEPICIVQDETDQCAQNVSSTV